MAANDVKLTFMVSERMADELRQTAFNKDLSASELGRACVSIGLELVKRMPKSLLSNFQDVDWKSE